MKDFEVIDDVISIGYQNRIKDYMACPNYPWFYGKAITHGDQSTTDPYSGFSNIIYEPANISQGADTLYPVLLEGLKDVKVKPKGNKMESTGGKELCEIRRSAVL